MTRDLPSLFAALDDDWLSITPDANAVRERLGARGETFRNDHVAFRTFDDERVNIATLAAPFLESGYTSSGTYVFDVKMLKAESFRPPSGSVLPHVFISELDRERTSAPLTSIIEQALSTLPTLPSSALERAWGLFDRTFEWPTPTFAQYAAAREHSEYASWLWAFGIRANHFTVDVNALSGFEDVAAVNAWLVAEGFRLNGSPPFIQGSREALLAQSSTLAQDIPWRFSCGTEVAIPSCYVEFAQRFPADDGRLFDGFVTQSADAIFESTQGAKDALPNVPR